MSNGTNDVNKYGLKESKQKEHNVKKNNNKHQPAGRRSGFTLIEIMLVVVIIGILAALAAPKIGGNVAKARKSAAKSDIVAISTAIDLYEMDMGQYPGSLNDLVSGGGDKWDGPYLRKDEVPKDPWGDDYIYKKSGKSYDVSCQNLSAE